MPINCLNHAISCLLAVLVANSVAVAGKREPKGPFKALEYRLIGPAAGGRVSRALNGPLSIQLQRVRPNCGFCEPKMAVRCSGLEIAAP